MQTMPFGMVIQNSIQRSVLILFKPFSLKKWFLLLFIAAFAGALSGGNFNFGGHSSNKDDQEQEAAVTTESGQDANQEIASIDQAGQCPVPQRKDRVSFRQSFQKLVDSRGWPFIVSASIAIAVVILAFTIFFIWLSARFKFVWLNAVINNDASVKEPFRRFKKEGDSLFKFFLAMFVVLIAWLGLLAAWVWRNAISVGIFEKGAHFSFIAAIKIFLLPLLALIAGIITLAIIGVFVDHFVVSIMGIDRCLFLEAWKKCIRIAAAKRLDFLLYFLLLIGLGVLSGIIALVAMIVLILACLLVAAICFGVPYLLAVVLLKVPLLFFTAYAVVAGLPFAVAVILLFTSIGLPFAVFFRNFSLFFLSALGCGYSPLPLNPPASTQS